MHNSCCAIPHWIWSSQIQDYPCLVLPMPTASRPSSPWCQADASYPSRTSFGFYIFFARFPNQVSLSWLPVGHHLTLFLDLITHQAFLWSSLPTCHLLRQAVSLHPLSPHSLFLFLILMTTWKLYMYLVTASLSHQNLNFMRAETTWFTLVSPLPKTVRDQWQHEASQRGQESVRSFVPPTGW